MTDDRAARLAALRASRAQTATPAPIAAAAVGSAPASVRARPSRPQQRVAAGARIVVTGLTASGVFGLTTVIAAANQPTPVAEQPTWSVAATALVTTPVNTPVVTLALDPTVPGVQSIVLTIPPLVTTAPPVGAPPVDAALTPSAAPAPNPAAAPAPTAALTPPPTVAPTAPPTTACTTNASGKCK